MIIKLSKLSFRTIAILTAAFLLSGRSTLAADAARFFRISGPAPARITSSRADGTVTWTNAVTNVTCTVQTTLEFTDVTNWVDYLQVPVGHHIVTHRLYDPNPPAGMMLIPAGLFTMGNTHAGDTFNDGAPEEVPTHTVTVAAFYMDKYEVTQALWEEVYNWATNHGYSFDHPGSWFAGVNYSKGQNHPVHSVNWHDTVKWCNARSEMENKLPAYYTNAALSGRYRSGQVAPFVNWNSGYRLPTEAEWEKAARGGASGLRFPWGDEITFIRANYHSAFTFFEPEVFELEYRNRFHPAFNDGVVPYTSPVGYFAPNGYGLYDMAGNVSEWCWDWYGNYDSASQTDPRGPASTADSFRVIRGGTWHNSPVNSRVAARSDSYYPAFNDQYLGFRSVLP